MIFTRVHWFSFCCIGTLFTAIAGETPPNQDMYLTALKHSQLGQSDASERTGQGYNYPQAPEISYLPSIEVSSSYKETTAPITEYGAPTGNDISSTSYNRPSGNYAPPSNAYGAPEPTYGAPSTNYGAPAPVYGAPPTSPPATYGPAPVSVPVPVPVYYKPVPYPHYLHDHWPLLAKIKAKLNILTIGKLLLKLVIFKKIIKFIGLICLLLVLPKIKDMFKGNMSSDTYSSDSSRKLLSKDSLLEKRIEELHQLAIRSLGKL